jgi:putative ABC transport system ATP-binding protein
MIAEVIRSENLFKSYEQQGKRTSVITDLDIQINLGEFTVLMGASGSGKSSLLYLLSGLDTASSGSIWMDGLPIHQLNEKALALHRRKSLGFIFQDNNLVSGLTLKENVLVAGYLSKRNRRQVNQEALSLLEILGLLNLADRLPSQVSGGELQRCAIARALINKPIIVMADEPTGSLNSESSEKVLNCLAQQNQQGQTILLATHSLKAACRGDKVLYLKDGQITGTYRFGKEKGTTKDEQDLFIWLTERGW